MKTASAIRAWMAWSSSCVGWGFAVQRIARAQFDKRVGSDRHQGIAARWRLPEGLDENDLLALVEKLRCRVIWAPDGVQDPHNLGACIRTAAAAGAMAVVVPKDRAVGLTPTVVRASAGMAAELLLVRVTNLARALERLKKAGVWVGGAAGEATASVYQADLKGSLAIVLGSRRRPARSPTRKTCDYLWKIPIAANVESLNVRCRRQECSCSRRCGSGCRSDACVATGDAPGAAVATYASLLRWLRRAGRDVHVAPTAR